MGALLLEAVEEELLVPSRFPPIHVQEVWEAVETGTEGLTEPLPTTGWSTRAAVVGEGRTTRQEGMGVQDWYFFAW